MAYRLCTSLPSWLEGFDPPYPLHFFGGIPERPKGADCKSASTSFDGSNPSPTTILKSRHLKRDAFFVSGFWLRHKMSDCMKYFIKMCEIMLLR